MIKFMILFHQPSNVDAFENVYQDLLALIERMPNIQRRQVVNTLGSPQGTPRYYRIMEVYFETEDIMRQALLTAVGQEAGKELDRLPKGSFELMFAQVFEEEGGKTPDSKAL